jgi:hypothetical protein
MKEPHLGSIGSRMVSKVFQSEIIYHFQDAKAMHFS